MALNQDQQAAVEWLLHMILETDEPASTLVGEGGTGKTYCIMKLAEMLVEAGLKVVFTAPTNKAVKQLEKAAREYGLSLNEVAFQTTHSALGLALLPNEDRKSAVRMGKGVIGIFDVAVVDEASMLSRYALYNHLLPEAKHFGTKLVFMGDDMQLPPPKEPVSPVFQEFKQFRLSQNMRQKEGQLLTINGTLRAAMMANRPFQMPELEGNQVQAIKAADFKKQVAQAFTLETDLEAQRVLAWSNKRVNELNHAIRQRLYGKNCPRFAEGERVVTGSPIKDPDNQILLGTDEECWIHHIDEESSVYSEVTHEDYRTIRLVLKPIYAEVETVIVEVLHHDEDDRFQEQLSLIANEARRDKINARRIWADFWAFKETFADIRYCYCITVHRSQGSTYDRVFLDVKDILRNRNRVERQRLLYVGSSRPRHELLTNKASYVA